MQQHTPPSRFLSWEGPHDAIATSESAMREMLEQFEQTCYFVEHEGKLGVTTAGQLSLNSSSAKLLAWLAPIAPQQLGNPQFAAHHGLIANYMAGAMANGIASEALVIALGQAGYLGSFGSGGLSLQRIEQAINTIKQALPHGPFAFNLLHNPNDHRLEFSTIDLYLHHQVECIEASAFVNLSPALVAYRVAGLEIDPSNGIIAKNRIIGKVAHPHVAQQFLQPPPANLLAELVRSGRISPEQANLAQFVAMADDITVEADSGGHTDNQQLIAVLPNILALRDQIQQQQRYQQAVRVGAAGGIGTPQAALAALSLGAEYLVTGSINQASIEAGTSDYAKHMLSQAGPGDTVMTPAADMFEQGTRVQVLKHGTRYPLNAQKLYDLYRQYDSLEAIPLIEQQRIEQQIFKRSLADIWDEVQRFFEQRDPQQLERAQQQAKHRMALVFRWYLGLSSHWAIQADTQRQLDYQIWTGPAMGAFNQWVQGSHLAPANQRYAVEIAQQIVRGTAYHQRIWQLAQQGLRLPAQLSYYRPTP